MLFVLIGACNSDRLEISEADKKSTEKIQSTETSDVVEDGCETAFAKKPDGCNWVPYVFAENSNSNPDGWQSLNLTQNRWGWAVRIPGTGEATFPLWAGAAKNDVSKGTQVGEVIINNNGSYTTITYTIYEGYAMTELHIYASYSEPTTIAPGQYGYTREFSVGVQEYSDVFNVKSNGGEYGFWIIAHAVVCAVD